MRFSVPLLFIALVLCGGLLAKPVYKNYIENDLSSQTRKLMDEKGWHGVQVSYDHLSPIASGASIYSRTKIIRAIDRNVWGAYVDPDTIKSSTLSPAKLVITIDRESKLVVLSGTIHDRDTRRKLKQAAAASRWGPEVDNILLVDDRLPSPSWADAAPPFITRFVNTVGTTGLTLSDAGGLILEGRVDFKKISDSLTKAGSAFSKVENLLEVSKSKQAQP